MDEDEVEEGGEDVGGGVAVCYCFTLGRGGSGRPIRALDPLLDRILHPSYNWFRIRSEKLLIQLLQDIFDTGSFIGERNGEEGFEC